MRIDFFLELYSRNLDHLIDIICTNDLTHRDIVNILRVSKAWCHMFNNNEGINTGSIWRRILSFTCKHEKSYKQLCILNRWWPDSILAIPVGDKEEGDDLLIIIMMFREGRFLSTHLDLLSAASELFPSAFSQIAR